jgi:hypothetical protein
MLLVGLEWAAAIVGQRCKRTTWQDAYKWLVILCWVTVVVETTGNTLTLLRIKHNIFYNVWGYLETGGIIFIQLRLLMHTWAKRLLIAMLIVLTAGTGINYIWGPSIYELNLPFQLFTLFIQLIATCAALIDFLGGNTSDKPLSAQPAFWLNAGMLFYCSVFILVYIAGIFFTSSDRHQFGYYFLACIIIANIFMYGGFIACFITLKRQSYEPAAGNVPDLHRVSPGD